jgi:hypothetical protein
LAQYKIAKHKVKVLYKNGKLKEKGQPEARKRWVFGTTTAKAESTNAKKNGKMGK